ncbi:MAG: ribosome silencing factor [Spirochaetaceae bacterium]|jgi:ribosome-associated protein|nr:ribosome silencing factor [Spirochaetaceae bacterium]
MDGLSREIKGPEFRPAADIAKPDRLSGGRTGDEESPVYIRAICALLEEHNGQEVVALDLRKLHSWTDFFVIATVTSITHLQGLLRHIRDFAAEQDMPLFRGQWKNGGENGWSLVDTGTAIIHLMTAQTREFYELEELWNAAERIYP